MPKFHDYINIALGQIRIREMRKDMFFGKILRNDQKQIKKFDLSTNSSVVVQFLSQPENLDENDIVLLLRKRNVSAKSYDNYQEFIFKATREPTISELKGSVISFKQLGIPEDELELAKYHPHEFSWAQIDKKAIENERKSKSNRSKKGGKKGNKKGPKQEIDTQPLIENLRKAPFLLKDGDIVGYRMEIENLLKDDDFQTFEDEENRLKFMEAKHKQAAEMKSTKSRGSEAVFKIKMDDEF